MPTLEQALVDTTPDWSKFEPGRYWIFLGYEKSGKTTAASTFSPTGEEGVLILDLEQGVRVSNKISIPVSSANIPTRIVNGEPEVVPYIERGLRRNGAPIESYAMVEVFDMLETGWDKSGKTTLVIDTIDKLSDWCNQIAFEEILEEDARSKNPKFIGCTCPEEIPYAAAFTRGRNKVLGVIATLLDIIGHNGILILNTHLKKTITITEGREVVVKRVPKLQETLANLLGHGAEAICHLDVDEAGRHVADFRGYSEVLMGSRIKPLQWKKFVWEEKGKNTLYNVLQKECSKKTA